MENKGDDVVAPDLLEQLIDQVALVPAVMPLRQIAAAVGVIGR